MVRKRCNIARKGFDRRKEHRYGDDRGAQVERQCVQGAGNLPCDPKAGSIGAKMCPAMVGSPRWCEIGENGAKVCRWKQWKFPNAITTGVVPYIAPYLEDVAARPGRENMPPEMGPI